MTCLLRLGAVIIDLVLWLLLAIFAITPALLAAATLFPFGYLENFNFMFVPIVSIETAYLAVAIVFLIFLLPYYPCRFESSQWQGTLGKAVLGLKCGNDSGDRNKFSLVAWRLTLQAIVVCMLVGIVALATSQQFRDLVTAIGAGPSSQGLSKTFRWIDSITPVILFAPYLVALFTRDGQTLIDLMVRRTVTREQNKSFPDPKSLIRDFVQILLPDDTSERRKTGKIIISMVRALWLFSLVLSVSAFLALPVSMFQADQLVQAQGQDTLDQHKPNKQKMLFQHLDLVYSLLASNGRASNDFRLQCLSKAIMLAPHQHAYWYWRAQTYLAEKRYTDALADASEAIKTYDKYGAATQNQSPVPPLALKVVSHGNEKGSLYSLKASIELKLDDKQAAFADLTKAISTAGHADDYKTWLELHEVIKEQEASHAKVQLAKASAIANEAYKILLKSPARFQEKKDLYNQMIYLNNAGVGALVQNNFDVAIEQFQKAFKLGAKLQNEGKAAPDTFDAAFEKWQTALDLNSRYELAARNLSIAYNGKAKATNDPKLALTYLHRALFFDSLNEPAQFNIAAAITKLGLDPSSFDDHIKLAESAAAADDLEAAIVEYELALKIKNDSEVEKKLALLKSKVN